jgi:dihydroneopterin aldolase
MLTIELSNVHFHAYHGLYEEEKKLGGDYLVNISITHIPVKIPITHLDETIDYSKVYEMVKSAMQQPRPLLETLVTTLAQEILTKFSQVEEVKIAIKKIHPPIIAFQGEVGVSYSLRR